MGLWTAFMVIVAVSGQVLMRDPGLFKRAQGTWGRGLLNFWGVAFKVVGAEHMDPNRSYVVMSNHLSWADIVALFVGLPVMPGFLAKKELDRIPFLSAALRWGGHVLIDRSRHDKAMAVLDEAAGQVRGGKTVLIFPEGTRGDSETIGPFKAGGFKLAHAAQVPIVPVGLRGSRSVFPRESFLVRPGAMELHIGEPIEFSDYKDLSFADLIARVRQDVMRLSAMPERPRTKAARGEPTAA